MSVGEEWTVVEVRDLSPSRRRLKYVFADGSTRYASVAPELDTPERRGAIADALLSERVIAKTPRGPEPRTPPGSTGWLEAR